MIEAASYTETSVTAYQTTRYHNSENFHHREHLISHYLFSFKTQIIYRLLSFILSLNFGNFNGYKRFDVKRPVHDVQRAGPGGRSLAGIVGSNSVGPMYIFLL